MQECEQYDYTSNSIMTENEIIRDLIELLPCKTLEQRFTDAYYRKNSMKIELRKDASFFVTFFFA